MWKKEEYSKRNQNWPMKWITIFNWVVIIDLVEKVRGACPTCSRNTKEVNVAIARESIAKDELTEVMENKIMYDLVRHSKVNDFHLGCNGFSDMYQQESDMIWLRFQKCHPGFHIENRLWRASVCAWKHLGSYLIIQEEVGKILTNILTYGGLEVQLQDRNGHILKMCQRGSNKFGHWI